MFRLVILAASFLIVSVSAYAEPIVCSVDGKLKRMQGDCYKLGICQGFNNSQINQGCIIATPTEYTNAANKYYKYDPSILVGERIVEMSQAEKDALDAAELAAQNSVEATKADNLNVTLKEAFQAFLKVYNSKVPAQYQVTGQQVIQQIKADKGL